MQQKEIHNRMQNELEECKAKLEEAKLQTSQWKDLCEETQQLLNQEKERHANAFAKLSEVTQNRLDKEEISSPSSSKSNTVDLENIRAELEAHQKSLQATQTELQISETRNLHLQGVIQILQQALSL